MIEPVPGLRATVEIIASSGTCPVSYCHVVPRGCGNAFKCWPCTDCSLSVALDLYSFYLCHACMRARICRTHGTHSLITATTSGLLIGAMASRASKISLTFPPSRPSTHVKPHFATCYLLTYRRQCTRELQCDCRILCCPFLLLRGLLLILNFDIVELP